MKSKNAKTDDKRNIKVLALAVIMLAGGIFIGYMARTPRVIPTFQDGLEAVATLDGRKFSVEELYERLKPGNAIGALLELVDEYIVSKELDDMTEAEEVAESYIQSVRREYPDDKEWREVLEASEFGNEENFRRAIIRDFTRNQVAEQFIKENEISDSEIRRYFNRNIEAPLTVRYILLQPENNAEMSADEVRDAEAAALARANEVINKLKNGEKFEDLAKEYSDDLSTAGLGGLYEDVKKGDVVEEFWNAASNLRDGQHTTTPVKSRFGYFVILRISQGERPTLEESRNQILNSILESRFEEDPALRSSVWIRIRESYNLDIIDSEIMSDYNTLIRRLNERD